MTYLPLDVKQPTSNQSIHLHKLLFSSLFYKKTTGATIIKTLNEVKDTHIIREMVSFIFSI